MLGNEPGPGSVPQGHCGGPQACQGSALTPCTQQAEHPATWLGSRAGLPGPPPCCHRSTPHTPPCLRLHKPAQGLSRSVSPQRIPWIDPCTAPGVPIPHTVTLGEPPGFSHNAPRQPRAEGEGAAGLHSSGTGSKFSIQGAGRAGLCQTPPHAALASDSPRSRPKTGRSAGSWRRA